MLKLRRYRWAMGVIAFVVFFGGVTLAVSSVGPVVRAIGAICSLASAVMADRMMPSE